jgi:hypothetical protein
MVTAHMVKPVNGDDLPNLRGMDGLKGNSPLGVEPKGEGISGETGYKVSGQSNQTPAAAPAAPAKVEQQKTKAVDAATQRSGSEGSVRTNSTELPVASVRPW